MVNGYEGLKVLWVLMWEVWAWEDEEDEEEELLHSVCVRKGWDGVMGVVDNGAWLAVDG